MSLLSRAIDDLADEWLDLVPSVFLVMLRDGRHEIFRLVVRHEIDTRAAKTCAEQPCAMAARMSLRQPH